MPPAMPKLPRPLIVKQLYYDLTPVVGLALVGHYLKTVQRMPGRLDVALPVKGGVSNQCLVNVLAHRSSLDIERLPQN